MLVEHTCPDCGCLERRGDAREVMARTGESGLRLDRLVRTPIGHRISTMSDVGITSVPFALVM